MSEFEEAGAGHNFLNEGAREKLKGAVERIERINEVIGEFNDEKSDIFKEMKAAGFDTTVMKQVIARRKKDRATVDEADSIRELYEGALGV